MMRAVFAGGGTGGHLFPAIAIADELKRMVPNIGILFVGTQGKIESRVAPARGYDFRAIWISGFQRRRQIGNLLFPLKIIVAVIQSLRILMKFRPQVVVGTGGYVAGPVVYAATLLGIPTLIHEQNSHPGVTTRLLARRVGEVHVSFEQSLKYFDRSAKVQVTGNPTRGDLEGISRAEALRYFEFDENAERRRVFIFGGSLGAHTINMAVLRYLDGLISEGIGLIWQTGRDDAARAKTATERFPSGKIVVREFIDHIEYAYAISDLVVCRAGATTIAELTRLGKPAILVPYPFAAADHQTENARTLHEAGAAVVVPDGDIGMKLHEVLRTILDGGKLREMSARMKALGKPEAARTIARRIMDLAKQ